MGGAAARFPVAAWRTGHWDHAPTGGRDSERAAPDPSVAREAGEGPGAATAARTDYARQAEAGRLRNARLEECAPHDGGIYGLPVPVLPAFPCHDVRRVEEELHRYWQGAILQPRHAAR